MRSSSIVCAGIVAACGIGAASAQTSVDRTFKASSPNCSDVQWAAYLGGVETPVSQLYRGAKLNFYVPEDRLTAEFFADDSSAKSVEAPIVREQSAAREPAQLAQSYVRRTVAARELPATAGGLPLVGWSAVLLILIGTGVTVVRMLQGSPRLPPKRQVNEKVLRER